VEELDEGATMKYCIVCWIDGRNNNSRSRSNAKARHHRYRVIDVGTFGGPNADTLVPPPAAHILTNSGLFVGTAETQLVDPLAPYCVDADCLVQSGPLNVAGFPVNIGTLRHGYSGGPIHPYPDGNGRME